jgi:hypothetical protein
MMEAAFRRIRGAGDAGQTLMRADHITAWRRIGASISRIMVMYVVDLPPDEENPLGATIYSHDQTPGMPRHEAVGLLRYTEARLLGDPPSSTDG